MNGYNYPPQQQQPQPHTQQHPQSQNAPIPGGINPSMLQGGGGGGAQGQMHVMNPMLARQQQQQQQALMGGMGMGAGGGMNSMNGMGGMPGMASSMSSSMNGMNTMGGSMGNMAGMGGMNGMGAMGGGAMNMPGRMSNVDLMNNMKNGGGGGMGGMNGMGFDTSMGMNPGMMNSGMGNVGGGMGMGGGVGSMSQQDLQKLIAQRQMSMGNMGGMPGMGMGGMGGMNMANQNAMNGMNPNMNAMSMGGMMGNNQNLLAMQQMQMQMQQQQSQMQQQPHMQHQSQAQQPPHTPNQVHSQSPHSASTQASSGNQYPPFSSQNQQTFSMPPPPRPNTAMSSSSHTSASQHPGPPPGMGMNMGSGIVRPPTASGQHPISVQQVNAQYPGGPQSAGHQISRPGTASGHPPQSAGGEPPRTPLIGQMPPSSHAREMSRPPSRPQTAQSNAGAAPQTPVRTHSPGAMRSMPSGQIPTAQMNGMAMGGAANAMNVMGGINTMNGRVPPGSSGMPPGVMGAQNPGMMMPPGMSRQPSLGGGQPSPIHPTHPQGPQTPHHQQPGMMTGRSTPTPLSAGGRMRSMSGAADGHDGGLGMGMAMGGIPGADGSTPQSGQMSGMGMMNNMMPNMGMGAMNNMGAMNGGMSGMTSAQIQQFQEMQQRKALAQAELAKQQQQAARMQQHTQMQSPQARMAPGAMPGAPGSMDGQAMGMGMGQPQSPAGGIPGMPGMGTAPQMPLGTPTRPSAAAAQMPGVQPGPSSIPAMGTPGRPVVPPGLGVQGPGLPSSAGAAAQINGAQVTATGVAASQAGPAAAAELPPLPANVQLNPKTTRVTAVPISEAAEKIPQLTEDEIKQVAKWREADKAYEARMHTMALRAKQELAHGPAGVKPHWWERDLTPTANLAALAKRKERFDLVYPATAQVLATNRKRGKRREGLRIPGKLKPADAERGELLVPIRLEFDVEHHKYRDTFVWNLNDPIVTPDVFAQSIVDDYGLPASFHSTISKSIEEQLSDHKMHSATLGDNPDEPGAIELTSETKGPLACGQLNSEDEAWWALWRTGLRNEDGQVRVKTLLRQGLERNLRARGKKRRREVSDAASEALSMIASSTQDLELPDYEENMHEEMRIIIKLDITVGDMKLDDQFEWDTENADPTPEQFAEIYSSDLGLAGEFKTAIAHSIREQVNIYQKSLFLVGHPSDGSAIQDDDLRMSFLSTVGPVARSPDATVLHQPIINYLSEGELDRIDKEREKEANRRRKRNTRGRRGVTLPDREPQKTHRTPAIGFPEIDPQVLALAAAAAAPTSRRAAAAAASLTIANMVASENGTAFLPSSSASNTHSAPSVPTSKIPKAKGSFKAPTYTPDIIKPRAHHTTPISSTAATLETYEQLLEGDAPLPASVIPAAPEPRPSRALTAKRQRELEKEAKEREYADGQHGNYIEGIWHCSNCGIPEDIAIGRRKGPLGDKSQCGACGKFWHRHRRPRPVEYHADKQWHMNAIAEAERAKSAARKKGGAAALRALTMSQSMSVDSAATPASDDPSSPPPTKQEMWVEIPTKKQRTSQDRDDINPLDRALSPASSISSTSASERPLAQMVGMNGAASKPASAAVTPMHGTSDLPQTDALAHEESAPPAPTASATPAPDSFQQRPFTPPIRPEWLTGALEAMRAANPEDMFDVVPRKPQNSDVILWKIKCNDCPGKLYNIGPEQTLINFEVHLKNRQHRNRVVGRRNGVIVDPAPSQPQAQAQQPEENGAPASPAPPTPAAAAAA